MILINKLMKRVRYISFHYGYWISYKARNKIIKLGRFISHEDTASTHMAMAKIKEPNITVSKSWVRRTLTITVDRGYNDG